MRKLAILFALLLSFLFLPKAIHAAEIYTTEKLISVDTSKQKLFAWENGQIVHQTAVSTGLWQTPTVLGTFRVYAKIPSQRMRGYSRVNGWYDHPNVTSVMYFYSGYAVHGAYWHNNFGNRMSNGCVNVPLDMAKTLFDWAPMGTQVVVF